MKIFWPHRSNAKGFSIGNLSSKYREKFSPLSSNRIPNQSSVDSNVKSITADCNQNSLSSLSIKRGHWANRDFSEYREAS